MDRRTLLSVSVFGWALVAAGCGSDDPTGPPGGGDNQSPTSQVSSPATGSTYQAGQLIVFQGTGSDPEDGSLSGALLAWSSNLEGLLGTGVELEERGLRVGSHTVTLTATDSRSAKGTSQIQVTIAAVPELPPVPPALIVFEEDMDDENNGISQNNFSNFTSWNVLDGCVDLHGPGSTDPLPGNGIYMDLDGTYDVVGSPCDHAGTFESKGAYDLTAANHVLELVVAGNNQLATSAKDTVDIFIGSGGTTLLNERLILDWNYPFTIRSLPFSVGAATSATVRFTHKGADQQGILIDAIRLRRTGS